MKRVLRMAMVTAVVLMFAATVHLSAQQPVRSLEDLVGARGSSAESAFAERGLDYVGGEKSDDSSYTYWRESKTGKCVTVRVADGRVQSIVYAPDADCDRVGSGTGEDAGAGSDDESSFDTVCGVIVDGKTHRYRCQIRNEGCEGQGFCRTILTLPDNKLRIDWHKGDQMEVTFEGMNPQKTTATVEDGQTRFDIGDQTYFVYRARERAKREVAKLDQ